MREGEVNVTISAKLKRDLILNPASTFGIYFATGAKGQRSGLAAGRISIHCSSQDHLKDVLSIVMFAAELQQIVW
jgi:hypothetical protein